MGPFPREETVGTWSGATFSISARAIVTFTPTASTSLSVSVHGETVISSQD
jgi:hypothetical protein